MASGAVFFHDHAKELFKNKTVIILGDSIHRSIYKDLVCLFKDQKEQNSRYLFDFELRAKGEKSFLGDCCLVKSENPSTAGTDYREVREFKCGKTVFRFYFITRVFSDYIDSVLNELKTLSPHVVIMNSTFWDIHRYSNGMEEFKANLEKLLLRVERDFANHLLFIWNAAPPLHENCKGGFLNPGAKTLPREQIIEANTFVEKKLLGRGLYFQFNDLFNALTRHHLFRQAGDGIHWGFRAHRKMSNMILAKICLAWKFPLPEPPQHQQPVTDDRADFLEGSPYDHNTYYPEAYYPDDEGGEYGDDENGYFLEQLPFQGLQFPLNRYEEPYPQGDVDDYNEPYYPPLYQAPPGRFLDLNHPPGFDSYQSPQGLRDSGYYENRFEGFSETYSLPFNCEKPDWPWNDIPTPPEPHRARDLFCFNQPFDFPAENSMGSPPWYSSQGFSGFSTSQQGTENGYRAIFRRFGKKPQKRSRRRKRPFKKSSFQDKVGKKPKQMNNNKLMLSEILSDESIATTSQPVLDKKEASSIHTSTNQMLFDYNNNNSSNSKRPISIQESASTINTNEKAAPVRKRKRNSADCDTNPDIDHEQPAKLLRAD